MDDFSYSTLFVSGDDAFTFLQGQLTNDLRRLEHNPSTLSAWCNPKGRVIALLRVSKADAGYALRLPAEIAADVQKRLTLFRFRAKVDFEPGDATLADFGATGSLDDWRLANLRRGIADIRKRQSEAYTPHMLNLDMLDAVSFDKGCYTGQEIVARTHYRGATKRRMFHFEGPEPVSEGAELCDGDKKIGDVVNAIGNDLLAVIPVENRDRTLTIEGQPINRRRLPYETV